MSWWTGAVAVVGLAWSLAYGEAPSADLPEDPAAAATRQTTPAGEAAAIDAADLEAFVDGFVIGRMRSEDVVGVTVSVVHGGETIFARGYGFDDLDAGRAVEAGRTLFRPGSISKTFTWTAVMQLVERGELDLEADIRSYLPNLEIADDYDEPITMLDLMAHTPGFEDSAMGHLFEDDPDEALTLIEYLRTRVPHRVRPPGVLPAYSNYGVAIAGLIVANISGMPWEDYVDQHLFEPLGMQRSTFREPWTRDDPAPISSRLLDHVSHGYVRRGGGFEAGDFELIGQVGPAGALSTTATDMARWMLVHLDHGRLGDARILREATARRMHSQHFSLDPRMPGMAHGFIESHIHGYRAIGHGGGTIHFLSDMQIVPELDLGVFISTNTTGGGGELIDEFVPTLVARYFPPGPLTVERVRSAQASRPLAEYTGTYLSTRRPYTTVERLFLVNGATVSAAGDDLLLVSPAGETRLEPLGGDDFRALDDGARYKFTADASGNVNALLIPIPILVMEKVGPLGNPNLLYTVLLVSAFVMACAVVGAWLRRKRPPQQTAAEAWAARAIVITCLVWLAAYLVALAGAAPLAEDFAAVFYGFPSGAFLTALVLGLVAAVLTVLSALLLYPVWSTGSWPVWRRLRHTAVVLAAVATLLVLRNFNAIGFNFI